MKKERLKKIFSKTDGHCHLCHRKLTFSGYGNIGFKRSWNIEHSKPKAKGGTDHLNNLYPACITCNTAKGVQITKSVRAKNGHKRAPLSKSQKEKLKVKNTLKGGLWGGIAGSPFGLPGVLFGAGIGAILGNDNSPKK